MLARIAIAFLFALVASAAESADLATYGPGQSPLGAVFAAPASSTAVEVDEAPRVLPLIPSRNLPGYYGSAGDFSYRNYYGTSPIAIFSRLPYACGSYGYC